ncbi:hypothetical protein [Paenibacillus naphthalenovorans]|uniref:Uncharacterized protein n=1 Tax=Paenibacillus naphthalenovorans TaxID=162209 RepID=A0A0U2VWB0_9BACL|nr:hypothetical protein [Paenibacillus naphthalenovorans]ALS20548.1 hypothetical protein IJ22_01560 [Paenibacillus naphthalenovorans]GCL73105.1 hypothetical protein PN4B1_30410 [Paenibacillus naphthalenovorans]SDI67478.1 hypothetical protein SAMN05421868_10936 [Paenibacillus naphthalenovorans]
MRRRHWFGLSSVLLMMLMSATVLAHESQETHASEHHARVGQLFYLEGTFDHIGSDPVEVRFQAVKLEDGAHILSLQNRSNDGSYKFGMQFFDGTEHEITVQAIHPANGSVLAEKKTTVGVEAFHPPMSVKIKTMIFLLATIAIGMAAGVGLSAIWKAQRLSKGGDSHVTELHA